MTVGELKKRLENLNDNTDVMVEEKISGDAFSFETMAGMYVRNGKLVIYLI